MVLIVLFKKWILFGQYVSGLSSDISNSMSFRVHPQPIQAAKYPLFVIKNGP